MRTILIEADIVFLVKLWKVLACTWAWNTGCVSGLPIAWMWLSLLPSILYRTPPGFYWQSLLYPYVPSIDPIYLSLFTYFSSIGSHYNLSRLLNLIVYAGDLPGGYATDNFKAGFTPTRIYPTDSVPWPWHLLCHSSGPTNNSHNSGHSSRYIGWILHAGPIPQPGSGGMEPP